ncbi:formate C-acetyltransferase/glycerol dehydratase family glycyl radical enzyme [bacterium]|nr:formate C-acetyltransferase/glycerol dehydratase family glycyl radical enzyme [bacterium]
MNDRIARLRQESFDTPVTLDHERAAIVTEVYREHEGRLSAPMLRATALMALCRHKSIHIGDDELIVGERGPRPKCVSTYPEVTCHSLDDLAVLDTRPQNPYHVSEETRRVFAEEIIPYWQGRSLREDILARMEPAWHDLYAAGVFTEFMEQRAPGHTTLDGKFYARGLADFQTDIERSLADLDPGAPDYLARHDQLRAMHLSCDAVVHFAERHADLADRMAATAAPGRASELREIARICRRVPRQAPASFHEALQTYWFMHLATITELNGWDAMNPGHLDRHLQPFFDRDLAAGRLDRERARELLGCFWVKFDHHPAPPKVGVTAQESSTYNDFTNINLGGVRPDGRDGVCELSYLLLEVMDEVHLLQPQGNVQLSKRNEDRFLRAALRVVSRGYGYPSLFNADTVVAQMLRQGKTLADARDGGTSGCVETGAFGKEAYVLTGYLNLPKLLELALHEGRDARTGEQLGPPTGDGSALTDLDAMMAAFGAQLRHAVAIKHRGNQVIEQLYAARMPAPFLSVLIDDCVATGRDYNAGGARYDTSYIQAVGIGTITDSLSALDTHVFAGDLALDDLLAALAADFDGHEPLRQRLLNRTPRWGNDDDRADRHMRRVFDLVVDTIEGLPNSRGGRYHVDMLPTTCHIYFGKVCGASPDGRRAGRPLSEGISPVQGADRHGPTAVLNSCAKMDHERTGGTLLNLKLLPGLLADEEGIEKLARLVRTYFRLGGHHVQFNVVDAATLRAAQERPEEHRDLIVRVAGYSDYFGDIGRDLQDEIIARTAQERV